MTVHTIGDSHSTTTHGSWPDWVVDHHLGPLLCYSFGTRENDISTCGIQDGDTVIFALGEIDCRCHVHKHVNCATTYEAVIDSLIDNYVKGIKHAVQNLDVRVGIYNVVPPSKKDTVLYDPHDILRPMGTDEQRQNTCCILIQNSKKNVPITVSYFLIFMINIRTKMDF